MERHGQLDYKDGHLRLSAENIAQLVKDPGLYVACPYLLPIKSPAMRFHEQLPKKGCSKCFRKKLIPVMNQITEAFVRIVALQADKTLLKKRISELSNLSVVSVEVTYLKNGKQEVFTC